MTQQQLKSVLDYDPETGAFLWKRRKDNRHGGQQAGTLCKDGYVAIRCFNKTWRAHWLAWFYVRGVMPKEVDHINLNRSDNRIANLRLCTRAQNHQNTLPSKRNTSGFKGVSLHNSGLWRTNIKVGNQKFQRYFKTKEEAAVFYNEMAQTHFKEFARVS
jgi:hypothetical protein